jgi:hypothetical protein
MAIEEDWHGRPMIDQATRLWLVAAALVAVAFFVGGALAGYLCPSAAVKVGAAVGTIATGTLVAGAVYRRLWVVHVGVPSAVLYLWILGSVAALILVIAGALIGRQLPGR